MCDPSALTLPPLGLAEGWPQGPGGGEQQLPGLELLWQQETGMSGPHPQGSSWWAGGKVQRKPRSPELLICQSLWGKDRRSPCQQQEQTWPRGRTKALHSGASLELDGALQLQVGLTSLSGAEAEGRTGPLGALWRKGRGHSEEGTIPGRHPGPLPSSNQQRWEEQKQSSGAGRVLPDPAQPEPSRRLAQRGVQGSAKSRSG